MKTHFQLNLFLIKKKKKKKILAPAPCNGTAATIVRVSLSTRSAIVVRCTAARAGYSVPLKRTVADVLGGS